MTMPVEVSDNKPVPSGSKPPSHGHGPGWGWSLFGILAWLVEMKTAIAAVREAYPDCNTALDILSATLHMQHAHFAGVAFWVLVIISSTIALGFFLTGKFTRKG